MIARALTSRLPSFLLLPLILSGCGSDEPDYLFASGLGAALEASGIVIPNPRANHDSLSEYAFFRVVAARASRAGDVIAVLDDAPPFLRIFDRDGRLQNAFVKNGDGPGESRNPVGLAIGEANRILLMNAGRLTLFDHNGAVLMTRRLEDVKALEIAAGCEGEWIIYGPERNPAGDSVGWLHSLDLRSAEPTPLRTLYRDTVRPHRFHIAGRRYGLRATDDSVMVRHEYGRVPTTLDVPCSGGHPRARETPAVGPPEEFVFGRSGEIESIALNPTRPLQAGMATRGGERVWAGWFYSDFAADLKATRMVYADGNDATWIEFPGGYQILDDTGEWLLISQFDPVPQVLMMASETFFSHIRSLERAQH